jgi:Response regulator containing a CheY-like receiver domain and an HTH DNA-binding domain
MTREMQILRALAEGRTNRTIAMDLHVSENTVKFHLKALFRRMGVRNRAEAVAKAARTGLLDASQLSTATRRGEELPGPLR